MPATVGKAIPIIPYRVVDTMGAQAPMRRYAEKSGQNTPASTFLYIGTPVQWDVAAATGYIIACPAMTNVATAHILGFSAEAGHNLTSSGVGKTLTQGVPQNQASAVIIPGGAWPSDGNIGIHLATDVVEFVGMLGNGSDDTLSVTAITMLASTVTYGLTQDATTKYWYVDNNKTTAAGGACVQIVGFVDPVGTGFNGVGTLNGRVLFRVLRAVQQYNAIAA